MVPQPPSRRAILKATGIALLIAVIILFTAVLPAEYGIDPTGIGNALGLTKLAESKTGAPAKAARYRPAPGPFKAHTVTFKMAPYQGFEYKLGMDQGDMMLYSWTAGKGIEYDFHGEPKGGPKDYFESYEKRDLATQEHGSLVAPFAGIHGWYWKNPTGETVTIKLTISGYYDVVGVKGASPDEVIVRQR